MAPMTASSGRKAQAATLVREFVMEKDTPNTKRFKEVQDDESVRPTIGTIYVLKKDLMDMGNTSKIRVTIEAIG